MKRFSIPTRAEQENFLIRVYFGAGPDYLRLCIRRAYLDFNRTLHGISKKPDLYKDLYKTASTEVEKAITKLRDDAKVTNQEAFDKWHRITCVRLCSTYKQHSYSDFHVGQAQKWLNMSLKYIYVIGDERYGHLYQFGHVPIDSIILSRLQRYNPPKLSVESWSRLDDYEEYLRFQQWIRDTFVDSIPLAVEFHLWLLEANE